jgi:hypothetical protein
MGGTEWEEELTSAEAEEQIARELCRRYNHARTEGERFQFAQALGTLVCPKIQTQLNTTRKRIMEVVQKARESSERIGKRHTRVSAFKASIGPKVLKSLTWDKYQLTPELGQDLSITGIRVPEDIVRELNGLLRWQVRLVKKEVSRVNKILEAEKKKGNL